MEVTSWEIENGLHQRLDVSAAEDANRVRNRSALLVFRILRRAEMAPTSPSGAGGETNANRP